MKLKKIVAAVCAAAMTASAVALTPLFASAEDVSVISTEMPLNITFDETGAYNPAFAGYDWSDGKTISCDDYTAIKMVYDVTDKGNATALSLTINGGSAGWNDGSNWNLSEGNNQELTIDFAALAGKDFNWVGYKLYGEAGAALTGNITIKSVTLVGKEEEKPNDANQSFVIWTGTQEMTEDWSQSVSIDASLLANIGAEGKLVMTIENAAAGAQYAVKNVDWADLNTNYDLTEGAASFSFDMTEGFANEFKANGFRVSGKLYTLTKIEYVGKNGGTSEPETPVTPETPETPAAPAANPLAGNCTVMPFGGAINLAASDNAAVIAKLKDGATYEYELSEMHPVIKRRVFRSIMGKDVTIKVTYRGMTWEYNGKEITEPHTINFRTLYEKAMAETEAE